MSLRGRGIARPSASSDGVWGAREMFVSVVLGGQARRRGALNQNLRRIRAAPNAERFPHFRGILAIDHHGVMRGRRALARSNRIYFIGGYARVHDDSAAVDAELIGQVVGMAVTWIAVRPQVREIG